MSNDYYNAPDVPTNYTLARAGEIRQQFAAIASGLERLPSESELRENRFTYAVAGGTENALTANLAGSFDAYNDGFTVRVKTPLESTGPVTINVNSLGAKSILDQDGNALASGALSAGNIAQIVYVDGAFRLMNSGYDVSRAETYANTATTQAGIATTQAGIATTQAGIATTKASEASASASAAAGSASAASTSAGTASSAASSAAASAVTAASSAAASLRATSATSFTAGNGSKTFRLAADAAFGPGQNVIITSASDPANVYMKGPITAYSSVSDDLTVNVTSNAGSGTGAHTDWVIVLDIGGSVAWGSITGSLASQTDLSAALTAKAVAGAIGSSGLTVNTARILGRTTASVGAVEEITVGTGLSLAGGALTNSAPMSYPPNGIAVASGGAWTTSKAAPSGAILGDTDAQNISNKTLLTNTIRADNTVTDTGTIAAESPGFRGTPRVADGARTLQASDHGKLLSLTGNLSIPSNATLALPVGFACTIYVNSTTSKTCGITSDTLRLGGTSTTGTRTMARNGLCGLVKVNTTEWVISGNVT